MNYMQGLILREEDVDDRASSSLPQIPHSPFSKTPPPPNMSSLPGNGSGSRPTTPPLNRFIHSVTAYEFASSADPRRTNTSVDRLERLGDVIYPLFCVPVYEHAWMSAGFGVWGKEDWLKEFWTVLDWEKVGRAFDYAQKTGMKL